MSTKTIVLALSCCVALVACGGEGPVDRQQSAANGAANANTPNADPNEPGEPPDESTEEQGEPPTCQEHATSVDAWATYANGHFSFMTPKSIKLYGDVHSNLSVSSELEDNTDPAVSKFFAETVVTQEPVHAAYWFIVDAGEIAHAGTPADREAELAAMDKGLPPADRAHNHQCGLVDSKETSWLCSPAVDATVGCWTIRGYSYEWSRYVYKGDRTFVIRCAGSGIVDEKADICAKVLASFSVE